MTTQTTPTAPDRRYLTLAEAGEITRLSTRTLRRAIAAAELRAHHVRRLVRIEAADLYRWLEDGDKSPSTLRHPHAA